MSEKIYIKDMIGGRNIDKPAQLLFRAMVDCADSNRDILKKFNISQGRDDEHVDVCLTVNGVEVPLQPMFQSIMNQFEEMVNDAAKNMFKEHLDNYKGALEQAARTTKRAHNKMLEKIGIKLNEDDWDY